MKEPQVDIVSFRGGIDRSSTVIQVNPGSALELLNFEPGLEGGYFRTRGFERTDGRAAPSSAIYYAMTVADGDGITVDSAITGGTSGATAMVVVKDGDTIGVTAVSGTFEIGETVGSTTVATLPVRDGIDDQSTSANWQLLAEDYYRALIQPVPGDGDILGVFLYNDARYAFRADSGEAKLYKSSSSGWVLVPYLHVLFFDGGTLAEGDIVEGTEITGASSSATATVKRFIKNAGSYAADASGYMVVDITSGAFVDDENIQVSAVTKCVANGASQAVSLAAGGKFQFIEHNFYGGAATRYIYGCDGVNPPFEFDGETLSPIYFPAPDENPSWHTPKFIEAYSGHLFLAYNSGQVAHSSIGDPLVFNALLGAAEFGTGDSITGMIARAGKVLAIYTKSRTFGLYGSSADDWQLQIISETFGAKPYSVKAIGTIYALDDKGIAPLERVDAYGDFESATVSRFVKPVLDEYKSLLVDSVVIRNTNQYRLFFSDGTVLVMVDDGYVGESLPSFSLLKYPVAPTCVFNNDDSDGNEVILMGAQDGYVYQLEKGYNFDGEAIGAAFRTPFISSKSPHIRKSYRRMFIDLEADYPVSLKIAADLDFGDFNVPSLVAQSIQTEGAGGFYESSDWNEIYWDAQTFNEKVVPLAGTGRNISLLFYSSSATQRSFNIQSFELHYLARRLKRV